MTFESLLHDIMERGGFVLDGRPPVDRDPDFSYTLSHSEYHALTKDAAPYQRPDALTAYTEQQAETRRERFRWIEVQEYDHHYQINLWVYTP